MQSKKGFFLFLIPFTWYCLVTVVAPFLNGVNSGLDESFFEHAAFVVAVPVVLFLSQRGIAYLYNCYRKCKE